MYPQGFSPHGGAAAWATAGRNYVVEIEEGAFSDAATTGSALANPMDAASFMFSIYADAVGPIISSGVPARGASSVSPTLDRVFLTFNEDVQPGDNQISIRCWDSKYSS